MNSYEETGFGPGSAADHPCVLGQVPALLPQYPLLQKEVV